MSGISSMMFGNFAPPAAAAGGGDSGGGQILFHYEGANASTTITNSISGGLAFTKGSNALTFINTAEFKFGSASYFCNSPPGAGPGGDAGIYPTTKTLANGSWIPRDYWWANDTTMESWIYPRSNSAGGSFIIWFGLGTPRFNCGFWNTEGGVDMRFEVEMSLGGSSATYSGGTGGAGYYNLAWTIGNSILNSWAHVALVRTGNALKLFINGVDKGTGTLTAGSGRDSTDIFAAGNPYVLASGGGVTANLAVADIGGPYTDYGFRRSFMDEFRFSNNVARYTTTFSVPTAAFPDA
jgi:hypothetical protein